MGRVITKSKLLIYFLLRLSFHKKYGGVFVFMRFEDKQSPSIEILISHHKSIKSYRWFKSSSD